MDDGYRHESRIARLEGHLRLAKDVVEAARRFETYIYPFVESIKAKLSDEWVDLKTALDAYDEGV